jgi:hypothetical protein
VTAFVVTLDWLREADSAAPSSQSRPNVQHIK